MLVCGPKRSPDHERQKTHDGLPRNGSLHLKEQILDLTLPGQFHAVEGDASPYKRVDFHRTPESLLFAIEGGFVLFGQSSVVGPLTLSAKPPLRLGLPTTTEVITSIRAKD